MTLDYDTGAMHERIEKLYYSEEYEVFLMAGCGLNGADRDRVGVWSCESVRPGQLERAIAEAEPWTEKNSHIRLSVDDHKQFLVAYDKLTQRYTHVRLEMLSDRVRNRILGAATPATPKLDLC